jgi:hypothetical protein
MAAVKCHINIVELLLAKKEIETNIQDVVTINLILTYLV